MPAPNALTSGPSRTTPNSTVYQYTCNREMKGQGGQGRHELSLPAACVRSCAMARASSSVHALPPKRQVRRTLVRCQICFSSAPRLATPMACTRSQKAGSASIGTWPAGAGRGGGAQRKSRQGRTGCRAAVGAARGGRQDAVCPTACAPALLHPLAAPSVFFLLSFFLNNTAHR